MEFQLIDQNNIPSSHIVVLFDHQYLWKVSMIVLEFLHRNSHQEKENFEDRTFDEVWPGVASHTYACPDLTCMSLIGLEDTSDKK